MNTQISPAIKTKALKLVDNGWFYKEVAKDCSISPSTVYNWVRARREAKAPKTRGRNVRKAHTGRNTTLSKRAA